MHFGTAWLVKQSSARHPWAGDFTILCLYLFRKKKAKRLSKRKSKGGRKAQGTAGTWRGMWHRRRMFRIGKTFSLEIKTPYFFNACCKTKEIFTRLHHRNTGHHHRFGLKKGTHLETPEFLQTTWTGRDTDTLHESGKTQTGEVYKPFHLCKDRFSREKDVLKYVECFVMFTYLCKCAHQHGACIPPGTGSERSHVCWHSLAGSHHSPPHTRPRLEEEGRWRELQDSLTAKTYPGSPGWHVAHT